MLDLRTGDRVLAVGWDGKLAFKEIYFWQHVDFSKVGTYATVRLLSAAGGRRHQLQLSSSHFMPAGHDRSGACSALAAAESSSSSSGSASCSGSSGSAGAGAEVQAAWACAAQKLQWQRDHSMMLPPQLAPGLVAWVTGPNGTATPACILSVEFRREQGAFSPVVRARGIVVDGVVASPFTRMNPVWGRRYLPPAADPVIPAIADTLHLPVYWLYKLAGPQLAWRVNNLPIFAGGNAAVANAVVWGHASLAAATAAAAVAAVLRAQQRRRRALQKLNKHKSE